MGVGAPRKHSSSSLRVGGGSRSLSFTSPPPVACPWGSLKGPSPWTSPPLGPGKSHAFSAQGAGRLGMPPLGPPSGVAVTIDAPAFGRFCHAGFPAQSLYILLQKVSSLECSSMHLPSFIEGLVGWVLVPYLGPVMGFGLSAGPQNTCSGSPQILFQPGSTLPLPHLLFQGSADFLIMGCHPDWPIWWGSQ